MPAIKNVMGLQSNKATVSKKGSIMSGGALKSMLAMSDAPTNLEALRQSLKTLQITPPQKNKKNSRPKYIVF